jgi:hypothetical protein
MSLARVARPRWGVDVTPSVGLSSTEVDTPSDAFDRVLDKRANDEH